MADNDLFAQYAEALNTLGSVDNRRRDALRRAVETATAAENKARTRRADQQRMYDRAAKDADDADRLLSDLRCVLGLPDAVVSAGTPRSGTPRPGTPPRLVEIRGQIREVAQWATEARPVAESLLRTQARLARAAPAPAKPAPPRVATPPASRGVPGGVIAAVVALVILVVVTVVLLAR
ncbi:hypothetical protein [Frankia sp. CiP1_Cm_nod2]|uniref:hypothetical protein n=1 Tax=Frankia sp. CiP1_Cm_nod2 TaxID=2897161 RepID=UPI0020254109